MSASRSWKITRLKAGRIEELARSYRLTFAAAHQTRQKVGIIPLFPPVLVHEVDTCMR